MSWHDIVITAEAPRGCCGKIIPGAKDRVIINGVNGSVHPGNFVSIIGASGAGKTTLLNYLSGRLISTGLRKEGIVKINGVDSGSLPGNLSNYSAYVQQDDVLFQTFTVRECLMFAAQLRLVGSNESKIKRVNEILEDLKLVKC